MEYASGKEVSGVAKHRSILGQIGHTFLGDIKVLAKATDKDFEYFQLNLQKAALLTALISQARTQCATAVQKSLQRVLMHTANASMTEGNQIVIRHMGQATNDRFGPFSAFFTTTSRTRIMF